MYKNSSLSISPKKILSSTYNVCRLFSPKKVSCFNSVRLLWFNKTSWTDSKSLNGFGCPNENILFHAKSLSVQKIWKMNENMGWNIQIYIIFFKNLQNSEIFASRQIRNRFQLITLQFPRKTKTKFVYNLKTWKSVSWLLSAAQAVGWQIICF